MLRRCFAVIPAAGLSRRMGQPKLLLEIAGRTVIARLLDALHSAGVDTTVIVGRQHDDALWREVDKTVQRSIAEASQEREPNNFPTSITSGWHAPEYSKGVEFNSKNTPFEYSGRATQNSGSHSPPVPHSVVTVRPDVDPPDMRCSIEHALRVIRDQFHPTDDDVWLLIPADHPVLDADLIRAVLNVSNSMPGRIVIPTHRGERGHPTALPWSLATNVFDWPADRGLNALIRSLPERVFEWETDQTSVLLDLDTPEDWQRVREQFHSSLRVGGVVVCGGKSTRMGRPKLTLPFGDEVMLQRVCRILSLVVQPIVVVAATDQEVPPLPSEICVVRDEYPDQGPLAGIATGLGALRNRADAAFITSCDVPLIKPEFIRFLIDRLGTQQAIVPTDGEHVHVLAAVYRLELESIARQLLAENRRRPLFLIEQAQALRVSTDDLRQVDANLDSLRNLNTPEDYAAALQALSVLQ